MRAWPTPTPAMHLATVAVARANAAAVRRVRRWTAAVTTLATVAAVVVAALFVHARLGNGGFAAWSDGTTVTSSSTTPWVVGAALTMAAVAVVAVRAAWDVGDGGVAIMRGPAASAGGRWVPTR
jgi:hypothetical protein